MLSRLQLQAKRLPSIGKCSLHSIVPCLLTTYLDTASKMHGRYIQLTVSRSFTSKDSRRDSMEFNIVLVGCGVFCVSVGLSVLEMAGRPHLRSEIRTIESRFLKDRGFVMMQIDQYIPLSSPEFQETMERYQDRSQNPWLQIPSKRNGLHETMRHGLAKWQMFEKVVFEIDDREQRLIVIRSCSHLSREGIDKFLLGPSKKAVHFQEHVSSSDQEKYFYAALYYYMQLAERGLLCESNTNHNHHS